MRKNAATGDHVRCNKSHPFVIEGNGDLCTFFFAGMIKVIKDFPAVKWIAENCDSHGSTLEGREDSFKKIATHKRKPAVLISEFCYEMYFPLKSAKHSEYTWIQYNALAGYYQDGRCKTRLEFVDGSVFVVNCDYRAVRDKVNDCHKFIQHLMLKAAEDNVPSVFA